MLPRRENIRFDDRALDGVRVGLTIKPPVLRRSTIAFFAAIMVAGIVYGTLVPFNFDLRTRPQWQLPLTAPEPGDTLANIIIYIPLGIVLRLLLRRRGSSWLTECPLTVLAALGISYGAEFCQQWLPGRVPTFTDTVCNVAGAFLGTLIAPAAQRWIRNFHAWLYQAMQTTPLTAIAGLLTVGLCVYALAPFDLRPTPGHLTAGLSQLHNGWRGDLVSDPDLSAAAVLSKWLAAGAYGLLAFLLTLSGREMARSRLASAYYGLTRACMLALAVELTQLFTVSHVADGRDLCRAWICCGAGTLIAGVLLWMRPLIYRDPAALVGPAVPILCPAVLAWISASAMKNVEAASDRMEWLPIMGNFSRAWNSVLASYASGFVNYILAVGAFVVWLRIRGHLPRLTHCVATGLVTALTLQAMAALFFGTFPDTGHIALAVLAGGLVHRFDQALFGRPARQIVSPGSH